jgi:pyruvate dehydrogenase E2 component (dihydrolipoamide acetyltransferase)/2-oxoisovalerate dehydrogenase E2 component (dihydrolipoyl transacylase)
MDFPLPPVGEGLFEVELVRWLVRPGDAVSRGQGLAEVMSDKASMEVPAPFAGTVTGLAATPGTKVKVGQLFLTYDPVGELAAPSSSGGTGIPAGAAVPTGRNAGATAEPAPAAVPKHANGHSPAKLPPAAPSVRMLARKLGVDLNRVRGTGPGGRVLVDDLAPLLKPRPGSADRPPAPSKTDTSKLDFGVAGTRQKLVGLRRKIAEHMVESTRSIPHYSYIDECDLTDLVRLRGQLRDPLAAAGVKLTYLSFLVMAAARALKEVPVVNSTFDEAAGEVTLHDRYHIGVAVAAPGGLIVPVVKDADKRDVTAVAAEIDRLSTDAKAGKSRLDDLKGGTFTVTSVGGIGGLISTPIINHPQVGIMGVGKVVKRPVYDAHGALRPADIIFLSFSFDHRVVDGAVGAAFGNAVVRYLQNPALLLLPEKPGG